jgi:hypothetical protein
MILNRHFRFDDYLMGTLASSLHQSNTRHELKATWNILIIFDILLCYVLFSGYE